MRTTKKLYKMIIYLQKLEEDCRDKGMHAQYPCMERAFSSALSGLRAIRIRLRDHKE